MRIEISLFCIILCLQSVFIVDAMMIDMLTILAPLASILDISNFDGLLPGLNHVNVYEIQSTILNADTSANPLEPFIHGIDTFMNQHPELNEPSSQYFSEVFTVLKTKLDNTLFASANTFLDNNPRLKLSASEYLKEDVFGPLSSSLNAQLKINFDTLLSDNPDLKLTVNEFTKKFIEKTQVELQDTITFLGKSPLAKDIEAFTQKSGGEIASDFSNSLIKNSEPARNGIVAFTGKLFSTVFGPTIDSIAKSVASSSTSTANTITTTASSAVTGASISPESIPLPSGEVVSRNLEIISSSFNGLVDSFGDVSRKVGSTTSGSVDSALTMAIEALNRAGSIFSSQLAEKGDVLTANIDGALTKTGDALLTIPSTASESFKAFSDKAQTSASTTPVSDLPLGLTLYKSATSTSTSSLSAPTASELVDAFNAKINGITNKVQGWKLFSDDNHWQNGYWEGKINQLQNTDSIKAQNAVNEWFSSKGSLLSREWEDYVKGVEARTNGAFSSINEAINRVPDNWARKSAVAEATYSRNIKLLEEYSKDSKPLVDALIKEANVASNELKNYSENVIKNGDL